MRSDMHKVVTERPRAGGRSPIKTRIANRPLDDLPRKESMRRKWIVGGNPKEFSDLINPLKRSLHKSVGRPWDKVYSEIIAALPKGIVSRHILQHVSWEVEINITMTAAGPVRGPGARRFGALRVGELYVNPNTGLLCVIKNTKR